MDVKHFVIFNILTHLPISTSPYAPQHITQFWHTSCKALVGTGSCGVGVVGKLDDEAIEVVQYKHLKERKRSLMIFQEPKHI